jgi:hypothetical protein
MMKEKGTLPMVSHMLNACLTIQAQKPSQRDIKKTEEAATCGISPICHYTNKLK